MRLHVEAEFTHDEAGRLMTVNDASRAVAPRFFFGSTPNGNAWWYRQDVNDELATELGRLAQIQPVGLGPIDAEPFVVALSRAAEIRKTWIGPAYRFPDILPNADDGVVSITDANATVLAPYLRDWLGDVSPDVPMFGALVDGKAVSVCASVRITRRADEAGVDTHPDFRRQGHAARVVRAWAKAIRDLDRIPLYSTSWTNVASRAVAKKLGLIQFGSDLHIT